MAIENINVGAPVKATGGLRHAPVGTAFPENLAANFAGDWKEGGYIDENGVTRTIGSNEDKIKAWGGDTVRLLRTEHSVTYKLAFLESSNAEVLKLLFGEDNVKVDEDNQYVSVSLTSEMTPTRAFALDMKDGEKKLREEIFVGQISLSGDVNFVHSNVIKYEVTIEALPNEEGVKARSIMGLPAS